MLFRWTILSLLLLTSESAAIPVSLNQLILLPSSPPENVLDLTLSSMLGTDRQQSEFSGLFTADIELDLSAGFAEITELTFTGGTVAASDVAFSFLGGFLSATTMNLAGEPSTPAPPAPVSNGEFAAADHVLTINQGTITAAGNVFDFNQNPLSVPGEGTGYIAVTLAGPPADNVYNYNVSLTLPVTVNETITVPDVPVFGSLDVTLSGGGTLVARDQFSVLILNGDYNFDGLLDCEDSRILGEAIAAGSTEPLFDADGDGIVDASDYAFWTVNLAGTLPGDANLDLTVDLSDVNSWNANKFTFATGICAGDFNGDARVDSSDFNLWNQHKFLTADAEPRGVPEPPPGLLATWAFSILVPTMRCSFKSSSRKRVHEQKVTLTGVH